VVIGLSVGQDERNLTEVGQFFLGSSPFALREEGEVVLFVHREVGIYIFHIGNGSKYGVISRYQGTFTVRDRPYNPTYRGFYYRKADIGSNLIVSGLGTL